MALEDSVVKEYPPKILELRDEGVFKGKIGVLDAVGAGVTASVVGNVGTLTIPGGGGGGGSFTIVEANLGSSPAWRGLFTFADATVIKTSVITIMQAPGPYTGKGSLEDEAEMDPLWCIAYCLIDGTVTVRWQTMPQYAPFVQGQSDNFGGGGKNALVPVLSQSSYRNQHDPIGVLRIGKIKGNVKFMYMVT